MPLAEEDESRRWLVVTSDPVYTSAWVELWVDKVELPNRDLIDHHALKFPRSSVGVVVVDSSRGLLIWRYRYITGTWGWENPAGWGDPGELPIDAACREVEEETGYRVGTIKPYGWLPPHDWHQQHALHHLPRH